MMMMINSSVSISTGGAPSSQPKLGRLETTLTWHLDSLMTSNNGVGLPMYSTAAHTGPDHFRSQKSSTLTSHQSIIDIPSLAPTPAWCGTLAGDAAIYGDSLG